MEIRHIKAGDEIKKLNGYVEIKDCNEAGLCTVYEYVYNDKEPLGYDASKKRYTLSEIAGFIQDTENVWCKVVYDRPEHEEHDYWVDTCYIYGNYEDDKWALMDGDDVVFWRYYEDGLDLNQPLDDIDGLWETIDKEIKEELGYLPEYSVN